MNCIFSCYRSFSHPTALLLHWHFHSELLVGWFDFVVVVFFFILALTHCHIISIVRSFSFISQHSSENVKKCVIYFHVYVEMLLFPFQCCCFCWCSGCCFMLSNFRCVIPFASCSFLFFECRMMCAFVFVLLFGGLFAPTHVPSSCMAKLKRPSNVCCMRITNNHKTYACT